MKITPVKFDLTLDRDDSRSSGLHVSNVIREVGLRLGYIPPQYAGAEIDAVRVSLGLAWESHVMTLYHPEVCYQPGERVLENIAMSVDGISYLGEDMVVHECKLTWKSMKREKDLEGEWLWLSQTMSYCRSWETNRARYHIYWVNGDYNRSSPSGGPHYRLYDLLFTAKEINDNWQMIKNSRHLVPKERQG